MIDLEVTMIGIDVLNDVSVSMFVSVSVSLSTK